MFYIDVHVHLTHEKFKDDYRNVIKRSEASGFGALVVNGLEPESNRQILQMAQEFSIVKPALGIYPIHAVNDLLPDDFKLQIEHFDVKEEIKFIEQQAKTKKLWAIGECGLDGYWLDASTYKQQEQVFEELLRIAHENHIPAIIHSRKLEQRTVEIVCAHNIKLVNFHCFSGKVKLAQKQAEQYGHWFSIPANVKTSESFQKMLKILPKEKILTETDAPYLAPERGQRNEPINIIGSIELLAKYREWTVEQARDQVWNNFTALFRQAD